MKSFDECLGELALEVVKAFRRNPEWLAEFEEFEDETPVIRPAIEPVVEPVMSGIYRAPRAYDQEKDLSFGGYRFNRKK